jgi:septum formation protein
MAAPLILASASPRRRELLARLGLPFEVAASDVPETSHPGEDSATFARRMAHEKATAVVGHCPGSSVLAADTVVVVDDAIFGKPKDRHDARRMLRALSGRTHRVLTAVALVDPAATLRDVVVESHVEFRELTPLDIERYLDSGEPFDKAGAYAVQGLAEQFVVEVRGSYSNVVGLPLEETAALLQWHLGTGIGTRA